MPNHNLPKDQLIKKLEFELQEARYIDQFKLPGKAKRRWLWKMTRGFEKIARYLRKPGLIKYKFGALAARVTGSEKYKTLPFPDTFMDAYRRKTLHYRSLLVKANNRQKDLDQIEKILLNHQYRGIVIYPSTISWEPLQRPQQLLRQFARQGYLCFFCEPQKKQMEIHQVEERLYCVSGEEYLIYPMQTWEPIVLCTWMLNLPFINTLPKKILWYDIIDRLEIFSLFDENALRKHEQVVQAADLVTFSALKLAEYTQTRDDAIYLPNGVITEDFNCADPTSAPQFPNVRLRAGCPIVGFFGAIAEWLDFELIKEVAEKRPDWEFVFMGQLWTDIKPIHPLPNIHFTGLVPYTDLAQYACFFDVAIIPFVVNQLTDSVSPIKFFEYAALGLPVITTPFYEITQYRDQPFLKIAATADEMIRSIEYFLQNRTPGTSEKARRFAENHHWKQRINQLLPEL